MLLVKKNVTVFLNSADLFISSFLLRHILAIVHFNFNLQREVKKRDNGLEQVKVSYPKFKNGEATVRNARIVQNFSKQHFYIPFLLVNAAICVFIGQMIILS